MRRGKLKNFASVVLSIALVTGVLWAQKAKTEKPDAKQHHATKPVHAQTKKGTDVTITITNCVADYTSVEASKTVTFHSADNTYWIFMDNSGVFQEKMHFQKISPGNDWTLHAHGGSNQITTLWWADSTTPCTHQQQRGPKQLDAGDPNDITVP